MQFMTDSIARSIGFGRFLGWKAVECGGSFGRIFICWDRRSLEILDWRRDCFTLSCRFRNVENGVVWVFTGVYDPFSKGGDFTWNGDQNNQTWACLDKFLVSLSWIDQFSGINQCKLPCPVFDHFPIIWWQGINVRGSASYKLATKMKEIKQKLKVWNREVFGIRVKKRGKRKLQKMGDYGGNSLETALKGNMAEGGGIETRKIRGGRWILGVFSLIRFSQQEAVILERPFTEDEIHVTLMEMNGYKSPCPDGFTLAFGKVKMGFGPKWWGGCRAAYLQLNFQCWLMECLQASFLALKFLDKEIPVSLSLCYGNGSARSASGLRINLAKSVIIPVGEVVEMEELAVELGCKVGSLPSQYLGLPLGALNRAPYMWDGVKYGQEDFGWRPKKATGAVGVGVWKEIWKKSEWCWDNMTFGVGKGNTIRLWTDVWCSESTLSHCFPHLFGMAVQRNSTVEGNVGSKFGGLKPSWEEDSVLWRKGRSGQFRVKEAYNLLVRSNDTNFPSRSIWVARVPTKVAFFAWEATWGRVLTLDRLQRRGLQLPNRCFLCGCEEESVNHILIHCTVVRALWDIVFGLVDVKWVFPETVKEVRRRSPYRLPRVDNFHLKGVVKGAPRLHVVRHHAAVPHPTPSVAPSRRH
ncbi:hypothetical protein CK203_048088 [Vitis vinifera]|uniref:Reverse transcriptase zinc-binding domain-containing protein n=1 Tax=Vitis vinifera TaxID=29760 RepID=A0A438GYX4_VITVI|nr:hypothetical protein CK203_048088 [Vitis vinifera]